METVGDKNASAISKKRFNDKSIRIRCRGAFSILN
jgi:hypothetical protein